MVKEGNRPTSYEGLFIRWLGGPSVEFVSGCISGFVDPFFSDWGNDEWVRAFPPLIDPHRVQRCDLVLITHEHEDHCDPVTIRALVAHNNPYVLAPAPAAERLQLAKETKEIPMNVRIVAAGEKHVFGELAVKVFRTSDPLSQAPVGYLLRTKTVGVAFMGDSLFDEELLVRVKAMGEIDAVFVSVGKNPPEQRYYYSVDDLQKAAAILYPATVIPIHWDLWTKTFVDLSEGAIAERLLRQNRNVLILHRGANIVLH